MHYFCGAKGAIWAYAGMETNRAYDQTPSPTFN